MVLAKKLRKFFEVQAFRKYIVRHKNIIVSINFDTKVNPIYSHLLNPFL